MGSMEVVLVNGGGCRAEAGGRRTPRPLRGGERKRGKDDYDGDHDVDVVSDGGGGVSSQEGGDEDPVVTVTHLSAVVYSMPSGRETFSRGRGDLLGAFSEGLSPNGVWRMGVSTS